MSVVGASWTGLAWASRRERLTAGILATVAAIAVLVVFGASSSRAAFLPDHAFVGSFNGSGDHQLGNPYSLAIDQQAHDVYVSDLANYRIEKFDSDGNFILMFGKGVDQTTGGDVCTAASGDICQPGTPAAGGPDADVPGQITSPYTISVDNSGGPSQGDVYVGEIADRQGLVEKFDSSGHIITSWATNGQLLGPPGRHPWAPDGIGTMGVDSQGRLWVQDATVDTKLWAFSPQGTTLQVHQGGGGFYPLPLQFDVNGNVYYSRNDLLQELFAPAYDYNIPGNVLANGVTGLTLDPTNDDVYVDHGDQIDHLPSSCGANPQGDCNSLETFGSPQISGGRQLGIDGTSNVVYVVTGTGVSMFASQKGPDVTTNPISGYGPTTATLAGHVDPIGAGDVTDCHFEYLDTQTLQTYLGYGYPADLIMSALATQVSCDQPVPFSSAGDVSADLSNLTPETRYSYRLVASNANGAIHGDIRTFVPHYVLGLSTDPATDIGPGGAMLHGSLDPAGDDTHYYFEWGTDTSYGHTTAAPPGIDAGADPGSQSVSADLSDQLTSLTTYHFRIVASNSQGTSYGDDQTFTTLDPLPVVIEDSGVKDVTHDSATFTTEIKPGFADTIYNFQYGETASYGNSTPQSDSIGNDNQSHAGATTVSGLKPGTTYHFRVVAISFKGTIHGPDQIFTTANFPRVDSVSVSGITQSTVTLGILIAPNFSPTTYHVDYGTAGSYGSSSAESAPIPADGVGHSVTLSLSGLSPATTYHYRVVATNSVGSSQTADQTFSTVSVSSNPPVSPPHCRRGFTSKHGKCVKRSKRRHRHHRHTHHRNARYG